MCGIAGHFGQEEISFNQLIKIKSILKHRGPDANGHFRKKIDKNNLLLLHTRLSIIDLNRRSNQPFFYDDSILIFNGEIYNYLELMLELKMLGHKFNTTSDTEVLIHSLRQWGLSALNKFEGMWAFAWYDLREKKLFLSRDRFGEKPLYYLTKKNNFYFGSETSIFNSFLKEKLEINKKHLLNYLYMGYKSLYKYNYNFFKKLKEVRPGTVLIISEPNKLINKRYWSQFYETGINHYSLKDNIRLTKEALIKAVKLRTRSDVPLAFCMSGGIDSNAIIGIAKKELKLDPVGFSVISDDKRYNEEKLIDSSKKYLGIKNFKIKIHKKNFFEDLKKIIHHNNSPLCTISYYLHWMMIKEISKKGFKVCLSGVGADEIFSGYYDHHLLYLNEVYKNKKLFQKSLNYWKLNQMKNIQNSFLKDPYLYINNKNFRDHIFFNKKIIDTFFLKKNKTRFDEKKFSRNKMKNRMLNELYNETVPPMLHDDDLNSMSFSVENRSPFLDSKIYKLASSFPTEQLIQKGKAKYILREAVKNYMPKGLNQNNRKIGFNASISEYINFNDRKIKDQILSNSKIFDIVKKSKIERALKDKNFLKNNTQFLFNFISSKIFIEKNNN